MRTIHRISLAAAVAIAMAGASAIAQTTRPVTTTTNGPNLNGGCRGTAGSSCTAGNFETSGTTTFGVAQSTTPGVTGSTSSGTGSSSTSSGGASVSGTTTVDPATLRPDPFGPGGPFNAGGTTSGTGTGSTTGSTGTTPVTPVDANGNPIFTPTVLPGSTGAIVLDSNGQVMGGVPQSQQNVVVQQPTVQARVATPIFDQVAREGRAKEERRKAQGYEPRIYGIAPRTNRDLTYQMPDDPIIRY